MGKRSKNQWWIFRQIWFVLMVLLGPKHVWIWYYLIYFIQYSIPLLYITIKSPFLNVWVSAHQVPHYRLSNALIFEFGAQAAELARPGPCFFLPSFRGGRAIKNCQFSSFFSWWHWPINAMSPYIPTVTVWWGKTRVRSWLAASDSTIEKTAIAEAKMNKSLWWGLDWDNKLSLNGRTFRIF